MSGQEHGKNTGSYLLPDIGPCTSSDNPVADAGSEFNSYSAQKYVSSTMTDTAAFSDYLTSVYLTPTPISSTPSSDVSTSTIRSSATIVDCSAPATDSSKITVDCSATIVDHSETTADCPATTADCPATTADCPATIVDCSETTVDCSATRIKSSAGAINGSETTVDCSETRIESSAGATNGSVKTPEGSEITNDSSVPKNRFTKRQYKFLEQEFRSCNTPDIVKREAIAKEVQLTEGQVRSWFSRKRTKLKELEREKAFRKLAARTNPAVPITPSPAVPTAVPYPSINRYVWDQGRARIQQWLQSGYQYPIGTTREELLRQQPLFVPNYYVPIAMFQEADPCLQQSGAGPSRRDRSRSPVNPKPSHDPKKKVKVTAEVQEATCSGDDQRDLVRNFPVATRPQWYGHPVGQFPLVVQHQQQMDTRPVRRNHSPVITDPRRDPVPGQEIKVRADTQEGTGQSGDDQRDLMHYVMNMILGPSRWIPPPK